PIERGLGLHDLQRDVEGLEVFDERAAVLADVHRPPKLLGRVGGEAHTLLACKLDDRLEAERAVEVDVEVRLRELLEELERKLLVNAVDHGGPYHGARSRHWPRSPVAAQTQRVQRLSDSRQKQT